MKLTFTATSPAPPDGISLKATLSYLYFFGDSHLNLRSWQCVRTCSGSWIVTDEACDLDECSVYPYDESFMLWLETVADEHLNDDPVEFLRNFVAVGELISPSVAEEIMKLL